jgi:molybdopterin-guanine dinucleotide biosynthesis protein A
MGVVLAGILVGGESRRMGRPKQLIELRGRTLLEQVAAALQPHAGEVVLLGAGPAPAACAGLRRLDDAPGLSGPLAGIVAAMRWRPDAAWIIAACDLPWMTAESVLWLLGQRRPESWAVMPGAERGVEPLLAVYEPSARGLLEELAARGRLGPSALAGHARVHSPVPPAELVPAWRSVNAPEDLRQLAGPGERGEHEGIGPPRSGAPPPAAGGNGPGSP